MTDKPLCPGCGHPKVWLSSPEKWICFKCEKPPETGSPPPWWLWIVMAIMIILMIYLMIILDFPTSHNGSGNLTQALDQVKEGGDLYLITGFLVIIIFGTVVAYALERGRERCPKCGEVLKKTPTGHYYCMHCRSMFDPDEIEVEVVE